MYEDCCKVMLGKERTIVKLFPQVVAWNYTKYCGVQQSFLNVTKTMSKAPKEQARSIILPSPDLTSDATQSGNHQTQTFLWDGGMISISSEYVFTALNSDGRPCDDNNGWKCNPVKNHGVLVSQ